MDGQGFTEFNVVNSIFTQSYTSQVQWTFEKIGAE